MTTALSRPPVLWAALAVTALFFSLGPDTARACGGGGGGGPMGSCAMGGRAPVGSYPVEDLPEPDSTGAIAFSAYCTQCHGLPSPKTHIAAEWDSTIDRMAARMFRMGSRGMHGVVAPSESELGELRAYLKEHAMREAPDFFATEQKSPGLEAFSEVCSQCHALPDPAQHTAAEWPGVVSRMQQNMQRMGVEQEEAPVIDSVVEFLSTHAQSPSR